MLHRSVGGAQCGRKLWRSSKTSAASRDCHRGQTGRQRLTIAWRNPAQAFRKAWS